MKNQIMSLVVKDTRILFRERNFLIMLTIFFLMSIASSTIGWFSQHTINAVYQAAVNGLTAAGKPVPPPPFETSRMLMIKNMIIYVSLIGALLAIILGNITTVNDRVGSLSRLLFTRLGSPVIFFWGKASSSLLILALILSFSLIVSLLSLAILHNLTLDALIAVSAFFFGAFIYLSGYVFLGIFFAIRATNSTRAILLPILLWTIITFAIPQMSLALYPTGSLNPVLPDTGIVDSQLLSVLHTIVYPFSISEHFKEFSGTVLGLTINPNPSNITRYSGAGNMAVMVLWSAAAFFLALFAVKIYKPENGDLYE